MKKQCVCVCVCVCVCMCVCVCACVRLCVWESQIIRDPLLIFFLVLFHQGLSVFGEKMFCILYSINFTSLQKSVTKIISVDVSSLPLSLPPYLLYFTPITFFLLFLFWFKSPFSPYLSPSPFVSFPLSYFLSSSLPLTLSFPHLIEDEWKKGGNIKASFTFFLWLKANALEWICNDKF